MRPLSNDHLSEALDTSFRLRRGDGLTQEEMDRLTISWLDRFQPYRDQPQEAFAVARPDGSTTGVTGPRWLFHLFGIRHRAVEVALATPSGLIVLQKRSFAKTEWPAALDMAVAGHVPQRLDGADMTFDEGAWKEISEEIGLLQQDSRAVLHEGTLTPVGGPYFCLDGDPDRNPPFLDAEVRQIFAGTLTGEGLARLNFADGEVAGLFLVTPETAWRELHDPRIASGLRYSLPRYLDWLEQRTGIDR